LLIALYTSLVRFSRGLFIKDLKIVLQASTEFQREIKEEDTARRVHEPLFIIVSP